MICYFSKDNKNYGRNKLFRCSFKHAFSEIITTINTAAIGNIEAISDGVVTPNYTSANVKMSDYFNTDNTVNANNIIWNGSAGSASVSLQELFRVRSLRLRLFCEVL